MDRLTALPDYIIEQILECLPLRDAVRMSSLSKKWRYKWAMLSKLVLDYVFFDRICRLRKKLPSLEYVSLVKTIMLQHIGPIHKLEIYIPDLDAANSSQINIIVSFALRNGVRELTMINDAGSTPHALPSFLFTCVEQLTKLELRNCMFDTPIPFRGFPNLKVLALDSVSCTYLDRLSFFISNCPELQRITLENLDYTDEHLCIHAPRLEDLSIAGRFRSISLQEVQNLVSLSIHLDDISEDSEHSLVEDDYMLHLFGNLGKIVYLTLGSYSCRLLAADCIPWKLPMDLDHLKTIEVVWVDLNHRREFLCLLCLIRSSPNLQQLEIFVWRESNSIGEPSFLSEIGDSNADCCLKHLRTVKICELIGTKAELKIIEFLLTCSPVLESMSIQLEANVDKDSKLEVSKELMRFPRVSPRAQLLLTYDLA